eukprot:11000268-Alexandrium_andersonii.AAC.1
MCIRDRRLPKALARTLATSQLPWHFVSHGEPRDHWPESRNAEQAWPRGASPSETQLSRRAHAGLRNSAEFNLSRSATDVYA